ncbi:hypothetical protein [Scrofimicrobium canadense]|nr:hypothetical protein [Scrofimicrobium canadense]
MQLALISADDPFFYTLIRGSADGLVESMLGSIFVVGLEVIDGDESCV